MFVNESLKPRHIDHILDHSGAQVLLSSPETLRRLFRSPSSRATVLDVTTIAGDGASDQVVRIGDDAAQII